MHILIDKVMDSLPENLVFMADSCQISTNQQLCAGTVWGPFDVDKALLEMLSKNQTQVWSNIKCVNADWVSFLVEKSIHKLLTADNEEGNGTITFSKRDFQITVSTNEDIDIGGDLKCNLAILDHLPNKVYSLTDSSVDSDQNTFSDEKMSKTCKFCGINFSHQCTLDAHMTYYCSKRQSVLNDSNPSPKCQKTWRTRQRNKQPNNQKTNSNDITNFNTNLFCDDSNQFKIIDRNISSKLLLNVINGTDTHQIEKQLNLNSVPLQKKSLLQAPLSMNGNSVVNNKQAESERLSNKHSANSDSEPENGTTSTLGFCAPCGLFFSSKELYNIHIQLDVANLQSSAAKCNSLVLAAPVFNNNGLQYVPIHPRTAVINTSSNNVQKSQLNVVDEHSSSIPLDLSVNNSSKSPINLHNERAQLDVANRLAAAAAGIAASNCNHILRSNKRPFLCQHCQTRFQLYSTFQAHQEFYCQGKRQQLEVSEKRCRTTSQNSCHNDFEILTPKNDDVNWKLCGQGFKCEGCGFIGQTKRGIRIHCKNQCFQRFQNQKSETKCDDVEISSPISEVWTGSNNATVAIESPEHSEFCHQDSPVKIESV